jgi:hypothetical protein
MATAGDELVNAFTGLRTVFRKTNGELLQVDWIGSRQDRGTGSTSSASLGAFRGPLWQAGPAGGRPQHTRRRTAHGRHAQDSIIENPNLCSFRYFLESINCFLGLYLYAPTRRPNPTDEGGLYEESNRGVVRVA